jgi:peptidoglycan/xylan/chitin deacetylase (PgdA/CDA1 family)
MQKSAFVISLDFELFWGVRDKRTIASYGANIRGVRQVIPSLLSLFEAYGIQATFATVGFLFCRDKKDLLLHLPADLPRYSEEKYSPYANNYLQQIGETEADDIYHLGWSLLEQIIQHPAQEIASHTFSHFYCLEKASLPSFEADLLAAKRIAAERGVELKSIVFPRNQYSNEHIAICQKLGFNSYRGNEQSAVYQPRQNEDQHQSVRAVRLMDSYLNLTGHHSFSVDTTTPIINIPASRFLRPWSRRLRHLDGLRLKRITGSMTHAAKKAEGYHLWWHPHNFGINLNENLSFLEAILKHFRQLHADYGMQSLTMKQVAEESKQHHAEATHHLAGR